VVDKRQLEIVLEPADRLAELGIGDHDQDRRRADRSLGVGSNCSRIRTIPPGDSDCIAPVMAFSRMSKWRRPISNGIVELLHGGATTE
jgi:hypothetical protein